MVTEVTEANFYMMAVARMKAFAELLKIRLSALVAFSCAFGYALAMPSDIQWQNLLMVYLGGFFMSGAAVTINQVIERDLDKLMTRTLGRPLPTGRVNVQEAIIFAMLCLLGSTIVLWIYANPLTVVLSLISMVLYSFVYTPLKRVGPIAVFVGAIPGALPPLLGWIAATGTISHEAMIIFGIQFIWQFPHFWAIAWVAHEDYERAGMKMLPREGKVGYFTAFQCTLYSAVLIPLSALPMVAGLGSWISVVGLGLAGIWYLYNSLQFLRDNSDIKARKVMFASFVYLPVVLITLLLDKYL